jgi:DNA-binding response OmpR family regulator
MKAVVAVIEDQREICDEYVNLIRAAWDDVEVSQAHDEASGSELLRSGEFDLVTLDIALGGGSGDDDRSGGLRLLAQMGETERATVIIVSSFVDDSMRRCLKAMRVYDILQKPHRMHEYLKAVRMGLEIRGKIPTQTGVLSGTVRIGKLLFEPLEGPPKWDGREIVGCTLTQQRLLHRLASANGVPVALRKLGQALPSMRPTDEAIRVHVSDLRKLLLATGMNRDPIESVTGVGYRWNP